MIDGGAGNDNLRGQGGDDEVYGGADDDHLWGDDTDHRWTPVSIHGFAQGPLDQHRQQRRQCLPLQVGLLAQRGRPKLLAVIDAWASWDLLPAESHMSIGRTAPVLACSR